MNLKKLASFQNMGALLWVIVVFACAFFTLSWFNQHRPQTDIVSLLPQSEQGYDETQAQQKLSVAGRNLLTILIEVPNDPHSVQAVLNDWEKVNRELLTYHRIKTRVDIQNAVKSVALRQITWEDERMLRSSSTHQLWARFVNLISMPPTPLFTPQEDPFGTAADWMYERASEIPIREVNGLHLLEKDNKQYLFSLFEVTPDKVYDGSGSLQKALHTLEGELKKEGAEKLIITGIPLFASYAAMTAQNEISILGTLSLIGVCLLSWLFFRRLTVLALILFVIAQAIAVAATTTIAVFGQIHMITFVFGTTLIGITVDYSAHYFGKRFETKRINSDNLVKELFPSLSLALISTIIAFMVMANTPMQGLQQMAVFCSSGVLSAFVAVLLWYPCIKFKTLEEHHALQIIGAYIEQLPSLARLSELSKTGLLIAVTAVIIIGLVMIKPAARLQDLNNSPAKYFQDAQLSSELINSTSGTQFFIVKGASLEDLLQKQEQLYENLATNPIDGVSFASLADWMMSDARMQHVNDIKNRARQSINPQVEELLGAPLVNREVSALTIDRRLQNLLDIDDLKDRLNLLDSSSAMVLVRGITAENLLRVKALGDHIDGVTWVNYTQNISTTLRQYRDHIAQLLIFSILAVVVVLMIRFRRDSWRAFLPTVLGVSLTLAILSLLGVSYTLFTVLALILLLGLGFDYGIFMTSANRQRETVATIAFAALTTLISFGLLMLSSTPALKTFGMTVAMGQCIIWTLTVFLRKEKNEN